jgi:hypothetical protein
LAIQLKIKMRRIFTLLFLLFISKTLLGDSTNFVTKKEVASLNKTLKKPDTKLTLVLKETKQSKLPSYSPFDFTKFLNFLAYLLIGIVVIGLIVFIIKDLRLGSDKKAKVEELDNIQDIASVNFDKMLEDALREGNYRLAVRIKFLMVIQAMQNKNLILWKPNKTNRAYVNEVSGSMYGNNFKAVVNIFDQVWYGNKEINAEQYNSIKDKIEEIFIQLRA